MPLTAANMEEYLNITDDVEGMRLELEEKGEDLFEAKALRPQLKVSTLSTASIERKQAMYCPEESRPVDSVGQLNKISNVGSPLSYNHGCLADSKFQFQRHWTMFVKYSPYSNLALGLLWTYHWN
jgi:hypothetical protein